MNFSDIQIIFHAQFAILGTFFSTICIIICSITREHSKLGHILMGKDIGFGPDL
jgi:hypothetical protein